MSRREYLAAVAHALVLPWWIFGALAFIGLAAADLRPWAEIVAAPWIAPQVFAFIALLIKHVAKEWPPRQKLLAGNGAGDDDEDTSTVSGESLSTGVPVSQGPGNLSPAPVAEPARRGESR